MTSTSAYSGDMAPHRVQPVLRARSCAAGLEIRYPTWARKAVLGVAACALLLSGSIEAVVDSGCDPSSTTGAPATGLKAHVDPLTGELISEPPAGSGPDAGLSVPVSPDYPSVVEQTRPDGTVVADVGDRFMTELRAEVVGGRLVTCHRRPMGDAAPAAPGAKPAETGPERGD